MMTTAKYIRMMETIVVPQLRSRLTTAEFSQCWWQQDGASCHTSSASLIYLKSVFGTRKISAKTDLSWPARSPDLNPLDYWFWTLMKRLIGAQIPDDIRTVKRVGKLICESVPSSNILKAVKNFIHRIIALRMVQGEHFEHDLKKIVRKTINSSLECEFCSSIHPCRCEAWDSACFERKLTELEFGVDTIDMISDTETESNVEDVESIDFEDSVRYED